MNECVSSEMPRYKSHKVVRALKIADIVYPAPNASGYDGSAWIVPEGQEFTQFKVDAAYMTKHKPKSGGYYVVYDDGYASWSPAGAFEEGYTLVE